MSYEQNTIEFETRRNEHLDAYFKARPQIQRTKDNELLVEAGFRMAWDCLKADLHLSGDCPLAEDEAIVWAGKRLDKLEAIEHWYATDGSVGGLSQIMDD